jgi:hypothetical protein
MDSLFRRGLISPKAMEKLGKRRGAKPKGATSVRDQGGVRDRGARVAGSRHIDRAQDLGSPARASGRPSNGGFVKDQMQAHSDEIDDPDNQTPAFPIATRVRAATGARQVGVMGPPARLSGPRYGGPSSRKFG